MHKILPLPHPPPLNLSCPVFQSGHGHPPLGGLLSGETVVGHQEPPSQDQGSHSPTPGSRSTAAPLGDAPLPGAARSWGLVSVRDTGPAPLPNSGQLWPPQLHGALWEQWRPPVHCPPPLSRWFPSLPHRCGSQK